MRLYKLQPGQSVIVEAKLAWLSSEADRDGVHYAPSLESPGDIIVTANEDNTDAINVTVME